MVKTHDTNYHDKNWTRVDSFTIWLESNNSTRTSNIDPFPSLFLRFWNFLFKVNWWLNFMFSISPVGPKSEPTGNGNDRFLFTRFGEYRYCSNKSGIHYKITTFFFQKYYYINTSINVQVFFYTKFENSSNRSDLAFIFFFL